MKGIVLSGGSGTRLVNDCIMLLMAAVKAVPVGGNTILSLTDVNGRRFSLKLAGADERTTQYR